MSEGGDTTARAPAATATESQDVNESMTEFGVGFAAEMRRLADEAQLERYPALKEWIKKAAEQGQYHLHRHHIPLDDWWRRVSYLAPAVSLELQGEGFSITTNHYGGCEFDFAIRWGREQGPTKEQKEPIEEGQEPIEAPGMGFIIRKVVHGF